MMLKEFLIRKGLSYRESEVAELVSQGLPNKAVADKLFVTEKTIKFHLTNIYRKLNIKSRAQLIIWCRPAQVFQTDTGMAGAINLQHGMANTGQQNLATGVSTVGHTTTQANTTTTGAYDNNINVEAINNARIDAGVKKREA